MRRLLFLKFLLLLCLLGLSRPLVADSAFRAQPSMLHFEKASSAELLRMGKEDTDNGGNVDTALVCYTIVANRHEPSMGKAETQECIEANMRLWSIYYYRYYDYPKCFECLARARELADEAGVEISNIYLGLGCMYQTISEESKAPELAKKALEYYQMALGAGIRTHDDSHTDMACTNVVAMSFAQQGLSSIADEWESYRQLPETGETAILRRYNKLLHQAYTFLEQDNPEAAIGVFDRQLQLIEDSEYIRLVYFTLVEKAKAYARLDRGSEAIGTLMQAEQIALSLEMKDCMLEVFDLLTHFYAQTGQEALQSQYRERYLLLKDTLTNYHQLASVSQVEFRNELMEMDRRVTEMRHHRQVMTTVVSICIVFLLFVLVFLVIVFRQNGKLKKSNRRLYQKNVEALRAETEERRMRKELQRTIHQEAAEAEKGHSIEETKYKNSTLSSDDKQQLVERIADVMDNCAEIFSPEFSVERLAQLADSKYKYVSQVIHEEYDANFNTFLNDYRIKEACKRINDEEHYGRLTMEAISLSVGFKSRSSFATAFKRVTGLTPSQYQKLATEQKD